MNATSTLRFDGCLATNLEQAYRHLEQVYQHLIGPLGLTLLEWYALRALYAEDGVSASRLAALVCRHPSSMTALLDRMEDKGLLRRQTDADDRRSVRVYLTDRGRAFHPQIEATAGQLDRLLANLIAPDQMAVFRAVLGILQGVRAAEKA
jgi:DNA-binding MarR family transcriptional regulator